MKTTSTNYFVFPHSDMPLDRILDAQTKSEKAGENPDQVKKNHQEFNATGGDPNSSIFAQIVEFAKNLPLFSDLKLDTQVHMFVRIYDFR